eukprot:352212-Chlamydomonas_euryale.AAC.1
MQQGRRSCCFRCTRGCCGGCARVCVCECGCARVRVYERDHAGGCMRVCNEPWLPPCASACVPAGPKPSPVWAQVVALLLGARADVGARSNFGRTPLHEAAAHPEVLSLLLAKGAAVGARDAYGHTPLHGACRTGGPEAVARLLEAVRVKGGALCEGVTQGDGVTQSDGVTQRGKSVEGLEGESLGVGAQQTMCRASVGHPWGICRTPVGRPEAVPGACGASVGHPEAIRGARGASVGHPEAI